jgi:hypothetical protein
MRPADFLTRLEDQPFQPFRIHLTDGTKIDVRQPRMVIVGVATVVLPTRFVAVEDGSRVADEWRTIALRHIVQFSDLPNRPNGSRRKKG